ncbi:MAG: CHASE2 domain-containing protein [Leptolyngbyaceae bacterium]|nr:CHASE2 domain-containing protein [Leptolyngbyaceae bacterium]
MNPPSAPQFHLNVQQIDQVCLFELTWGQGQRLTSQISYSQTLEQRYHEWRQIYFTFYTQLSATEHPVHPPPTPVHTDEFTWGQTDLGQIHSGQPGTADVNGDVNANVNGENDGGNNQTVMRGKVIGGGRVTIPSTDWHGRLVQAEAALTYEFQRWLRHGDLFEIRAAIANHLASSPTPRPAAAPPSPSQIFLSCRPLMLARFPWETWELGTDLAGAGKIQVVRSSLTVNETVGTVPFQRRQPRILVILGDSTGLNFQGDRQAVQSLTKMAEVVFTGWQPGQSPQQVRTTICEAIADEVGWDGLLFVGHSDEKDLMGGQLAIAPNVFMSIKEMAPYVAIARDHGLQFALFNSCMGLDIAESLINLGISQVIVMREPIHNRVAHAFIQRFMQQLAQHVNVQSALFTTCEGLKLDQQFAYPSAHLVPSLFCHPHAHLFQIPPRGWKQQLKSLVPLRYEAIALATCLGLSLLPITQTFGLDQRLRTQAIYRHLTGQIPSMDSPPLLLVQIDDASIRKDPRLANPNPIDRSYLADLIRQLSEQKAAVIGVDYLLDRQAVDPAMEEALRQAIAQAVDQEMWLVFGSIFGENDQQIGLNEDSAIKPGAVVEGHINVEIPYMTLTFPTAPCPETCPFAYLLSLMHQVNHTEAFAAEFGVTPTWTDTHLLTEFTNAIQRQSLAGEPGNPIDKIQQRSQFHPLTLWSYYQLGQPWLGQLLDFSIPPNAVYDRIPAWAVLDERTIEQLPDLSDRTVMIVPGGYDDAGIGQLSDNAPLPSAIDYWYTQFPPESSLIHDPESGEPLYSGTRRLLPKGEGHAYMFHHFLTQRRVIHIPTSWMVAIAALLGYLLNQWLHRLYPPAKWTRRHRHSLIGMLTGLTGLSALVSLQLFISAGILFPWTLPTVLFWIYQLRMVRKKPHA